MAGSQTNGTALCVRFLAVSLLFFSLDLGSSSAAAREDFFIGQFRVKRGRRGSPTEELPRRHARDRALLLARLEDAGQHVLAERIVAAVRLRA